MDIQTHTSFFMWCAIINVSLYALSVIMLICLSDFVYRVHCKWFPMTKETYVIVIYSFIGLYKILLIVFVVVP